MGIWDITGYSKGGRRPLTYNLMPGQFRNTRVNIFPSKTIINNNIMGGGYGCYDYGAYDDCGCGSSTPKWMNWMMGLGLGTSMLSGILGGIFGTGSSDSSSSTEGAGDKAVTDKTDLNNLKTLYKSEYNIVQYADGSFAAKPKNGGKIITAGNAQELMTALEEAAEDKPTTTSTSTDASPVTTTTTTSSAGTPPLTTPETPSDENPADGVDKKSDFGKLFTSNYMQTNYDPNQGLKVGNTHYKTLTEAFSAYSNGNNFVKPNNSNNLNGILSNITGIYDDGKNNGSDVADFVNAKPTLDANKTYKANDTITIGNHTYKIVIKDGYMCLEDTSPKGGLSSNPQLYMLEQTSNGKYQLHQRPDIIYNEGIGKYAH